MSFHADRSMQYARVRACLASAWGIELSWGMLGLTPSDNIWTSDKTLLTLMKTRLRIKLL